MKNLMLMSVESLPTSKEVLRIPFMGGYVKGIDTPEAFWLTFEEAWIETMEDLEYSLGYYISHVDQWLDNLKTPVPAIVKGHSLYFRQQDIKACIDAYRKKNGI